MKYTLFSIISLLITASSCSEPEDYPRFLTISEFNIDTTIIEDGADIEIIGYSGAPSNYKDNCYTHAVAINQASGDTINLLLLRHVEIRSSNRMQNFISPNSNLSKIMLNIDPKINNMHEKAAKWHAQAYTNARYVGDEWNRFPSIIGNVGKVYSNSIDDDVQKTLIQILEDLENDR